MSLDRSFGNPVVIVIPESTTETYKVFVSAVLMDTAIAWWGVHEEIRFSDETGEDVFRLVGTTLKLVLSETLFAGFAELYFATPL